MTDKEYLEYSSKMLKYLMGYSNDQKLPKYAFLRLRGLLEGKFIANNKTQKQARYSYEVVLNTFRYFKPEIDRALASVNVNDEKHKINLILSIVDKHLNDTLVILQKKQEAIDKINNTDIDVLVHQQVEYKPKTTTNEEDTNNKLKSKLKELW